VNLDPKLLIAGLCLLAISFALAFILKRLRRWRLEEAIAPRPRAAAGPPAQFTGGKLQTGNGGTKTIAIVHDFDNPHGGNGRREELTAREAFEVLAQIRSVDKDTPIDIVLHTPGGDRLAGELIANALKDRPNTTAYVPYFAMSAGTMIALAAEKVVMGRNACLGPIDAQIGGFPSDTYARLLKEKPVQHIGDVWLLLSYLVEKDLKTARQRACELLNKHHFGSDDACQLTDFLVSGGLPHSERIGRKRAEEIGVNIARGDCPDAVYRIVEQHLELLRNAPASGGFDPNAKFKPLR
jgi:hypothetical protein